jgi:hypothetical protein
MWPAVIFRSIIVSCVAKRTYLAVRSLGKALECVVKMKYSTFSCRRVNCSFLSYELWSFVSGVLLVVSGVGLAARLLGLWVRIPSVAGMFVPCECCVLSGRGLCDGSIPRLE